MSSDEVQDKEDIGSERFPNKPWRDESLLRELYGEQGQSQTEIADLLGCGNSTVSNQVRKFGIEKAEPNDPYRDASRLEELYWEEGMSVHEVADELETDGSVIHEWMERYDIPRRQPDNDKNGPWRDAETLRELYWDEELAIHEIAAELGCGETTVARWMERHGVERRKVGAAGREARRVGRATFYTDTSGYEMWAARCGYETENVHVHRLVAVAEYGFDAVAGKVVHHGAGQEESTTPWDNRPENLAVMTDSEHKSLHARKRGRGGFG